VEGAAVLERLAPVRAPITWRTATVKHIRDETPEAKTLVLDVPDWPSHEAGQHVDIRLTAEDGYQAERSYSIASAPDSPDLELTIERIEDGEVSPYLTLDVVTGDTFELRGPIGGYFTWTGASDAPLLLIGGGSGVVPLMAMLRHHRAIGSKADARLLLSARAVDDILYRDELSALASSGESVAVTVTLTRGPAPPGWTGLTGRIDGDKLAAVAPAPDQHAEIFVCGPTGFVEHAARLLIELGHPPITIRTERFGPTGG
jgi:ferredoxin-NADP reductase